MMLTFSDKLHAAGCEVSGDGDFVVLLSSIEFGNEYFCYETEAECEGAFIRLSRSARKGFLADGIEREVSMVYGWPLDLDYIDAEEEVP